MLFAGLVEMAAAALVAVRPRIGAYVVAAWLLGIILNLLLIGPDTITTIPPATLDAFRDHGRVRVTLGTEGEEADSVLATGATLGVDVHALTEQLQADAIKAFAASFEQLVATVGEKRNQIHTTAG